MHARGEPVGYVFRIKGAYNLFPILTMLVMLFNLILIKIINFSGILKNFKHDECLFN